MLCEGYCEPRDVVVVDSGSAFPNSYFIGYRPVTENQNWKGVWEMARLASSVREIHEKHIDSGHDVSGIILVKFTINLDGSVVNDSILFSTTENQKFDTNIRNAVRERKWEGNESKTTTVTFPLTFWKTKDDYETGRGSFFNTYRFAGTFDNKKKDELNILLRGYPEFDHLWRPSSEFMTLDDIGGGFASLSELKILLVFWNNGHFIWQIYNRYLERNPDFGGRVSFRFTITGRGKITDINVVFSSTHCAEFDNEVKDMVASWRWKRSRIGQQNRSVTFNFFPDRYLNMVEMKSVYDEISTELNPTMPIKHIILLVCLSVFLVLWIPKIVRYRKRKP
jgi:TonB family protein